MTTQVPAENSPSAEDLANAFNEVFKVQESEPEEPAEAPAPEAEPAPEPAEPAEPEKPAPEEAPAQESGDAPKPSEDVESLKTQLEAARKEKEEWADKASKSLEWSRSLALRKASEADRLRSVIKDIHEGKEVDSQTVEKILANQQAAPVPQDPFAPPVAPQPVDEIGMIQTSQFLADYRLNNEAADKFKGWLNDPSNGLTEKDVVPGDLYHSYVLAYHKYEKATAQPSPVTVKAAQTLQRVQREQAKSAGNITSRARPSPPPEPEVNVMELAKGDPKEFRKRINIDDLIQRAATGE